MKFTPGLAHLFIKSFPGCCRMCDVLNTGLCKFVCSHKFHKNGNAKSQNVLDKFFTDINEGNFNTLKEMAADELLTISATQIAMEVFK